MLIKQGFQTMPKDKEIVDLETDYIKTLEKANERLILKYSTLLTNLGSLGDKLKEVQELIIKSISEVLKP